MCCRFPFMRIQLLFRGFPLSCVHQRNFLTRLIGSTYLTHYYVIVFRTFQNAGTYPTNLTKVLFTRQDYRTIALAF